MNAQFLNPLPPTEKGAVRSWEERTQAPSGGWDPTLPAMTHRLILTAGASVANPSFVHTLGYLPLQGAKVEHVDAIATAHIPHWLEVLDNARVALRLKLELHQQKRDLLNAEAEAQPEHEPTEDHEL